MDQEMKAVEKAVENFQDNKNITLKEFYHIRHII
jgi:hypothetical protein